MSASGKRPKRSASEAGKPSELWEERGSPRAEARSERSEAGTAQNSPPTPPAREDDPGVPVEPMSALVGLCHELGREDLRMAILAEGNASVRTPTGMMIKASGRRMTSLGPSDLVACRREPLLELFQHESPGDEGANAALLACREDQEAPKPSVEAMFHAWLLGLPRVYWVSHAHPIGANRVLCSPRAPEFATRRMFPDEVVCCAEESVLVPYTDPGLALAVAIKKRTEKHIAKHGTPPRVILLANHGVITLGATPQSVVAAMQMTEKAAEIFLGAALLGGPNYLSGTEVRRISDRPDEHHRRAALNI